MLQYTMKFGGDIYKEFGKVLKCIYIASFSQIGNLATKRTQFELEKLKKMGDLDILALHSTRAHNYVAPVKSSYLIGSLKKLTTSRPRRTSNPDLSLS